MRIKIFTLDNNKLQLNHSEILLVKEFREVMESDKSRDKKAAYRLFHYVYLLCDWQSPYFEYKEEEKQKVAKKDAGILPKDLKNPLLQPLIDKYTEVRDSNRVIRYIQSAWQLLDKISEYTEIVDFNEKIMQGPRTGALVHSVKEARDTVLKMQELIEHCRALNKMHKEEMKEEEDTKVRGDHELPDVLY